MLASLLPGLRDLRAPLSAGYLWLAAGWLYFAPRLPTSIDEAHGVLRDVFRVVQMSSPVLIGAGLTFVAYMVGILSTGLLTRTIRIVCTALLIVAFLPIAIIVLLLDRLLMWWRPYLHNRYTNAIESTSDSVRRFVDSPYMRAEGLVIRRLTARVLRDPASRDLFLKYLADPYAIRRYIRKTGNPRLYEHVSKMSPSELFNVPLNKDEEKEKILQTEVRNEFSRDLNMGFTQVAQRLVQSVVNIRRHGRDILNELKLVPERIVGDKPATYERWDRLSAEAEFRQAVVPPLIAVLAALVSRGVIDWSSATLLLVPPLVILFQGIRKENAAQAQLIQILEAEVIKVAPIERLETNDLYFLGRQRQEQDDAPGTPPTQELGPASDEVPQV